jgi:hypothetical protein
MRKKQFQLLPLEYSTDVRWSLISRDMIRSWLMPQLFQDKPSDLFQHNGAPSHIHSEVTTFWNRQLPERRIGRERSTYWPPRSPYLTPLPLCFILWGCVKDEVYVPPVTITLKILKDRIRIMIIKTDQPLLQNVRHDVEYRLMRAGQQMEYILNLHRT